MKALKQHFRRDCGRQLPYSAERRGVFRIAYIWTKYLITWVHKCALTPRSSRTLEWRAMRTLHPQQMPYWRRSRSGGLALAWRLTPVSTRQLTHSQHVLFRHQYCVFGYVIKCHLHRLSALCRSRSSSSRRRRRVTWWCGASLATSKWVYHTKRCHALKGSTQLESRAWVLFRLQETDFVKNTEQFQ